MDIGCRIQVHGLIHAHTRSGTDTASVKKPVVGDQVQVGCRLLGRRLARRRGSLNLISRIHSDQYYHQGDIIYCLSCVAWQGQPPDLLYSPEKSELGIRNQMQFISILIFHTYTRAVILKIFKALNRDIFLALNTYNST